MRSDEDIRKALAERLATLNSNPPANLSGRGIVICAGGAQMFTNAYVLVFILRRTLKTTLPIEVWHLGEGEMTVAMRHLLEELDVRVVDAESALAKKPARIEDGWQLKSFALMHSGFAEVLLLDADQVPIRDPGELFEWPEFKATGAVFWPDIVDLHANSDIWRLCGLPQKRTPSFESGQVLVDKRRHWRALGLALYLNEEAETFYEIIYGDKDTFFVAWLMTAAPHYLAPHRPFVTDFGLVQRDRGGDPLFQHRCTLKFSYGSDTPTAAPFEHYPECQVALLELSAKWAGRLFRRPPRSAAARRVEDELAGTVLRIMTAGTSEEQVGLLGDGDIGEGRAHDRQHWYVIERDDGLALIFSNGERETAWLRQDGSGWRGRRLSPPPTDLFAASGEIESYDAVGRHTLVDDLLEAAGLWNGAGFVLDTDLEAALHVIDRAEPVADRLREIANDARLAIELRDRIAALARTFDDGARRKSGAAPRRPLAPTWSTVRRNYIDSVEPDV